MHVFVQPNSRYRDREQVGQVLARHLCAYAPCDDVVVLALPRGGIPVAREVADTIGAPLDLFLVRKLGLPGRPELAMGAVATGEVQLLDDLLIREAHVTPAQFADAVARERREIERRERVFRADRPPLNVTNKRVLLIDDGVATGYTMRVAVLAVRRLHPAEVTVAVPVGARETCIALAAAADELVCPLQPTPFHAVGLWYDHFPPLTDEEVRETLLRTQPL